MTNTNTIYKVSMAAMIAGLLSTSALAQSVGASVSGDVGGVSADADAGVSGPGGPGGVSADADAGVSGPGVSADADASVGGDTGANANASIGGVNADANVSLGTDTTANVDVNTGSFAEQVQANIEAALSTGPASGLFGVTVNEDDENQQTGTGLTANPAQNAQVTAALSNLSSTQKAQLRKRCAGIMANPGRYSQIQQTICELAM